MEPAKVLCIDDEPELLSFLTEELEEAGFKTMTARDGLEALRRIEQEEPDLVLCDVNMPKMTGYDLLEKVRQSGTRYADTPFIMLTALADREYMIRGLANGADDYLTKPVDFELLLVKVEASLRQVARMKERKHEEQVRLYKALSKKETGAASVDNKKKADTDRFVANANGALGAEALGNVRLLTLEPYREKFGDQWPEISRRAMTIAGNLIATDLRNGECFIQQSDNEFVISFAGGTVDEIAARMARLSAAVRKRLLGEDPDAFGGFSVKSGTIDKKHTHASPGELNADSLAKALAEGRVRPVAADEQPEPITAPWKHVEAQLETGYAPVWSAITETIVAFRTVPRRSTPYGVFTGHGVLHGDTDDPMVVDLDMFQLRQAVEALRRTAHKTSPAYVHVPVVYSSIQAGLKEPGHADLFKALTDESVRTRLTMELTGIPEDISRNRLNDAVTAAQQHSGKVFAHLNPARLVSFKLDAVGLDGCVFAFSKANGAAQEKSILKEFKLFADALAASDTAALVTGIDDSLRFQVVTSVRTSFISGRCVGPERPQHGQRHALKKAEIILGR